MTRRALLAACLLLLLFSVAAGLRPPVVIPSAASERPLIVPRPPGEGALLSLWESGNNPQVLTSW